MAVSCGKCDLNFWEPKEGPEVACDCIRLLGRSPLKTALEILSLKEYEWSASVTGYWDDDHVIEHIPKKVGLSSKEKYGLFR